MALSVSPETQDSISKAQETEICKCIKKRAKLQEWHQNIWYDVLPFRNGHIGSYDSMFGRFPPERRYNMEQIPMPFIVEHSDTYTEEDDEQFHVRGTGSEVSTKRKYTVNIFINARDNP